MQLYESAGYVFLPDWPETYASATANLQKLFRPGWFSGMQHLHRLSASAQPSFGHDFLLS
jgi:hypothetical protein